MLLLAATLSLYIAAFSLCLQNAVNAGRTISQQDFWQSYEDYESVLFFSREETDDANRELDNKYAAEFYQKYVDRYDISLAFNISDNGGMSASGTALRDPLIYVNANGAKKIPLPVDSSDLEEDSFYIISLYTEEQLKEKDVWSNLELLNGTLSANRADTIYITVEQPYKTTLLDIKADNLADNYVKNPILFLDTHNTITEEFAANIFTGIVRFTGDDDFHEFIEKINYEGQVWYSDPVFQIYEQKRNTSIMTASVNLVLAVILSLLFYVTFYTVLKSEFQYRAEEIAIRKILGEALIKRYSLLFKIICLITVLTTGILLVLHVLWNVTKFIYIMFALIFVYCSVAVIILIFTNIYERHNIVKTLKGGYGA